MKRLLLLVLILAMVSIPSWADEWDKQGVIFDMGTTASGNAISGCFRVPQSAKIDTVYLTESTGAVVSTSNYDVITMYLNGDANGTRTTSTSAITANTPATLTPTISNLSAGDVVQFRGSYAGTGTPTTDLAVTMSIFNTTSR
jgi:hypothetical protein